MYIATEDYMQVVNSDFVHRFCLVKKPDAVLVVASYGTNKDDCVTIGRYSNIDEARDALSELCGDMCEGRPYHNMMMSSYGVQEMMKHDARVKRKGGS